jgi:hypothetical protein|tara:strand:+ start:393 stop:902 length:510 start_codon:yes stop_codon:yes gene_type:complete
MKIKESKIKKYSGETFNVTKVNKVSRMTFSNGDWLENKEYYGKVFLGDCDSCGAISKFYKDFVFDKILIVGLGMGLLPNYAKHIKNCSVIDVIEKNKEVIEYVDYLDDSINIIEADAYDYIPLKKYDLIIFDLWWKEKDVTLKIKNSLNKIYKKALTDNGKIIFPLIIK